MSCPTCSHTMQPIGVVDGLSFFWCPRCGTLRSRTAGGWTDDSEPKLVLRCRRMEIETDTFSDFPPYTAKWHQLGIDEAIRPESSRVI